MGGRWVGEGADGQYSCLGAPVAVLLRQPPPCGILRFSEVLECDHSVAILTAAFSFARGMLLSPTQPLRSDVHPERTDRCFVSDCRVVAP